MTKPSLTLSNRDSWERAFISDDAEHYSHPHQVLAFFPPFFFMFASRCCSFRLYLLFSQLMPPLVTGRQCWSRALLMSVPLLWGCQGAHGMWPAQAKLGRCDSDNSFPISGSASRPRFCHSLPCRASTTTRASSQGPGLQHVHEEEHQPWRSSSRETGLEMLQGTPVPLQNLRHFLLFQQKEMLSPARGSCSIPSGSSPIAFAGCFSAALPTFCHLQLFLPPPSQVTVTDGRWRDVPGQFIQLSLTCAEVYNFRKF